MNGLLNMCVGLGCDGHDQTQHGTSDCPPGFLGCAGRGIYRGVHLMNLERKGCVGLGCDGHDQQHHATSDCPPGFLGCSGRGIYHGGQTLLLL